jgi:hypothetical protein
MQTIQNAISWFSKQKLGGKIFIGCSGIFLLLCLCSFPMALLSPSTPTPDSADVSALQTAAVETAVVSINQTANASVPTNSPEPTNTPLPTETSIPTNTPDPNLISSGTYIVNVDIQAGIYKGLAGEGLTSSCYWERLKDLTGNFDSILANDNGIGQYYIEVQSTDYALKTACQLTRLSSIPAHSGEYPLAISSGTYLIGSDIQPGTYKGQGGNDITSSCYWERLRSVSGGLDSILANDNGTGQYYVQVLPSDFALKTACPLEWVSP